MIKGETLGLIAVSIFFPGAGHAYKGRWRRGLLWTLASYLLAPLILMGVMAGIVSIFGTNGSLYGPKAALVIPVVLAGMALPRLLTAWDSIRVESAPLAESTRIWHTAFFIAGSFALICLGMFLMLLMYGYSDPMSTLHR